MAFTVIVRWTPCFALWQELYKKSGADLPQLCPQKTAMKDGHPGAGDHHGIHGQEECDPDTANQLIFLQNPNT